MRRNGVGALLVTGALLASSMGGLAAHADGDVDPRIEVALAAEPGGVVVDDGTVVWPALGMQLDVATPSRRSVGSCATGSHCAYSGIGLTGSKLSWTTCSSSHSVAALGGVVRSIASARSTGSTSARSASGGVLATASAGGWANVSGTVSHVSCTS